jgi:hypothetical protein
MVGYRWFLGMIVVFTAARLVLVSVGLPRKRISVFQTRSPSGSIPSSPDGSATSGDGRPDLEPREPDLDAAREARSRTSLRSPPCVMPVAGCGREADLVLPDQVENALRIVWVMGRMWVAHHRAASGSGEGSQNSGPEYSSSGGAYTKNTFIPRRRSSRAQGVPVLDQERHAEQRQCVALTGRWGNRIERSKPKHARDPLLAVSPEVGQAAQRPLQIARPLSHPVIRYAVTIHASNWPRSPLERACSSRGTRSGTRHGPVSRDMSAGTRSSPRVRWRSPAAPLAADRARPTAPLPIGLGTMNRSRNRATCRG